MCLLMPNYALEPVRSLLLTVALLLPSAGALAHPGGLNAEGCHTNHKTGDYHCHRAPRAAPKSGTLTGKACGSKYYCKEMASCEEAMHYLNDCGLSRLDGDGDGVPCESICGHH